MTCRVRTIALIAALPLLAAAKDPTPAPSRSEEVQGFRAPDMSREFALEQVNPHRSSQAFQTSGARTHSFEFQQKFQPKDYETREFRSKSWWGGGFKFSTTEARTKGYATKEAPTKAAPVKEAREAAKTAPTRALPDGRREYLGPEAAKAKKPLVPEELPKITNDLRRLETIEDVKELLNKSK
jgi:hypothetical protein